MSNALSTLVPRGRDFFSQITGQRWPYIGLAASALFKRWLMPNGPSALVEPNLAEYRSMADDGGYDGEITLRVYRGAAEPNRFALDPWSYPMAEVTAFTQFCNERRFRVDWTAGDYQLILPDNDGPRGRQEHINQFCAAHASIGPTNFIQGRNEPFKNGGLSEEIPASRMIDPASPWGTYLRDSGWYFEGVWNRSLILDCASYHTPRNSDGTIPKWSTKQFESAPYLWDLGVPVIQNEQMGFGPIESGSRSTNPYFAMLQGLAAAVTGVGFLVTSGHACDAYHPIERACCVAYFRGAAMGVKALLL